MRATVVLKYLGVFFLGSLVTAITTLVPNKWTNDDSGAVVKSHVTDPAPVPSSRVSQLAAPVGDAQSDLSRKALEEIRSIVANELSSHRKEQQVAMATLEVAQYDIETEALTF